MDNIEYKNVQIFKENNQVKIKSFFDNIPSWLWLVIIAYFFLDIGNEKKKRK